MHGWRNREDRKPVCLSVRLRTDGGWSDATVRNVSSRGMMLQSLVPLERNQFVEVARGKTTVVARIVWSTDSVCGLRTQDRVDIDTLLDSAGSAARRKGVERRSSPRSEHDAAAVARPKDFAQKSAMARMVGKRVEAFGLLAALVCAGAILASSVFGTLADPLDSIKTAMGGSR